MTRVLTDLRMKLKPFYSEIGRPSIGLYVGMGDRLDLKGVRNDYPRDESRQHARDRHAVAGGLDHHLVPTRDATCQPL